MINLPILYSFRRCPYAMRARLALLASGVSYEHREVVLRDKPPELLAASPKATVPVLVLPSGKVIEQSQDILLWALRQHDPYNWLAHEGEAVQLMSECDGDFKHHLDRYKYPNRYEDEGAIATEHRGKAAEFAAKVNTHLGLNLDSNTNSISYIFNSNRGIYYAGYMSFIRQYCNTDKAWFSQQPWPHLQAVLAHFEASPEFKTIMQTHAPFNAGNA